MIIITPKNFSLIIENKLATLKNWVYTRILRSDDLDHKFIFIVGCYNSGTTLLNHLLKSHCEISGLHTEGVALTSALKTPEEFGWNRMWHMCREKIEIPRFCDDVDPKKVKKDWKKWFDPGKKYWIEKSIVNALNIDWLQKNFQNPYFIWIIRNGYAVTEGIKRRTQPYGKHPEFYTNGYPIELCAKQWVISNEVIEEKLKNINHYIKITYENLTENTSICIKNILNWLPVSKKEIKLPRKFSFQKEKKAIFNMNHDSIDRLSKNDIRVINGVAKNMLIHHRYNIIEE